MPESGTKQVFALMQLSRGRPWRTCTEPVHYDVRKQRLGVFLTSLRASEKASLLGITYLLSEEEVNRWLESFLTKGKSLAYEIGSLTLYDWCEKTASGIIRRSDNVHGDKSVRIIVAC